MHNMHNVLANYFTLTSSQVNFSPNFSACSHYHCFCQLSILITSFVVSVRHLRISLKMLHTADK